MRGPIRVHLTGSEQSGWALDADLATTRAALRALDGQIVLTSLEDAAVVHSVWEEPILRAAGPLTGQRRQRRTGRVRRTPVHGDGRYPAAVGASGRRPGRISQLHLGFDDRRDRLPVPRTGPPARCGCPMRILYPPPAAPGAGDSAWRRERLVRRGWCLWLINAKCAKQRPFHRLVF